MAAVEKDGVTISGKPQLPPRATSMVDAQPVLTAPDTLEKISVPPEWFGHLGSPLRPGQPLTNWMDNMKYKIPTGKGLPYTHTLFTGGLFDVTHLAAFEDALQTMAPKDLDDLQSKVPVPLEAQRRQIREAQEREFWHVYGQALHRSRVWHRSRSRPTPNLGMDNFLFLAEKRTEVFRYYIDLDFKSPRSAPDGYPSLRQLEERISDAELKLESELAVKQDVFQEKWSVYWSTEIARCKSYQTTANHDRLLEIVALTQEVLREFYRSLPPTSQTFQIMVCLTTPPLKPETTEVEGLLEVVEMQKDGVHLIFPHLYVTEEQALYLRATLVSKLESKYGLREGLYNSWLDVVDEGVYRANSGGLRMLGSRKATRCNAKCDAANKRKHFKGCDLAPEGAHHEDRYYWPEYLVDGDGTLLTDTLNDLLDPIKAAVLPNKMDAGYGPLIAMSSVRCWESDVTPGFRVPVGAPQPKQLPAASLNLHTKHKRGKAKLNASREHKEDERALNRMADKQPLPPDHPWIPLLQEFVRNRFHEMYKELVVSQVMMLPDPDPSVHPSYMIRVKGPGSSYCQNISDDHRSNTIWFLLTSKGRIQCVQKCFCRCNKKRESGVMCKNYSSAPVLLSHMPNFASLMFPPIFHTDQHPVLDELRKKYPSYRQLEAVFLPVLWNRIDRDSLKLESGDVQSSDDIDEELTEAILREIRAGKEAPTQQ